MEIQTLTPIWTGGANKQMDRIYETGLLGSLRWWYETLLRGVGGKVCELGSNQSSCEFDNNKYTASEANMVVERLQDAGLCGVCQIFGTTGWERRFRLAVGNVVPEQHIYTPAGMSGKFHLQVVPLWRNAAHVTNVIKGLIQFIADWGALGASTQQGFGVISLTRRYETNLLFEHLVGASGNCSYHQLPSLKNMFFTRIRNSSQKSVKGDIKRLFSDEPWSFVLGKKGKCAAKIKISSPYKDDYVRIWGWLPERSNNYVSGWNREKALEKIHDYLRNNYNIEIWREMGSNRDTVSRISDPIGFLNNILN